MRHGVLFYEATGLFPSDLTFPFGVLFYEATRIPKEFQMLFALYRHIAI